MQDRDVSPCVFLYSLSPSHKPILRTLLHSYTYRLSSKLKSLEKCHWNMKILLTNGLLYNKNLQILRTSEHRWRNNEERTSLSFGFTLSLARATHHGAVITVWERAQDFHYLGLVFPSSQGHSLQCFMLQNYWTYSSENTCHWWCHKSSKTPFSCQNVICSVSMRHPGDPVSTIKPTSFIHLSWPNPPVKPCCLALCTFLFECSAANLC